MKKIILCLLISVAGNSFASGNMEEHNHEAHEKMGSELKESESFNLVLTEYEKLNQAFISNKNQEVKKNAKSVIAAIDKVDDKTISKTLQFSKKKLEEILKSDDIKANQEAFNTVSQGIHVVLSKYAGNKKYARYYCPMVKKYWIQNIEKTKDKVYNPYASTTMPDCGSQK